jgi:bifunctional non-homologous end joining protein LigD
VPAKAHSTKLAGTDISLNELPEEQPRFIRKMDCVAVDRIEQIPAGKDWFREIKWDGYRVCVIHDGKAVSLRTKSNREPSARYKHIEKSLRQSSLPACVMDAELVALDPKERPVFQLLQQSRRNRAPVVIYVFDLLNYTGRDLTKLPLSTRRAALEVIASEFPEHVRLSELLPEDTPMPRLVLALDEHGLEGIVVKRKDSLYREGKEPGTWIKHRLYKMGEFIIGGYLKRDDPYFDALIVGEKSGDDLHYKEKVRFGFDDEKKRHLLERMDALRAANCPFDNLPEKPRRGALDAQQLKEAVWLRPELRCTVKSVQG